MTRFPGRRAALAYSLIALLLMAGCVSPGEKVAAGQEDSVTPAMKPFPVGEATASGYLKVSDLHELYWEVSGNPEGVPVIVLHGGPGGSARADLRKFFDPDRFLVVLFDQRGAGRSRPAAEWRENTTQDLVDDIGRLRAHLGIEKSALIWGGSWGSTLALAYAETHPELVRGLVLRGVFLGTKAEIDHFYHGGVKKNFPEAFERLQALVPNPESLDYPRQLFEMTQSEDPAIRRKAIRGWAWYEIRMVRVGMTDKQCDEIVEKYDLTSFSVLENYYMAHGCFLEEGQLIRDVGRIAHIPTFIVNGRFDLICTPRIAWELASHFETVRLELPPAAAHSAGEAAIEQALMRGTAWVADQPLPQGSLP